MFGRSKGRAEETLAGIFSDGSKNEGHVSARPAVIFDRPGEPVYGFFDSILTCWPFSTLKGNKCRRLPMLLALCIEARREAILLRLN